ncbi:MAG: hypothetical protein LQ338_004298 [Usnochroma carphineum]|nr:MAG: hypothetical protein LQ338_004298 [Usnochroma carphineum]
MSQGMSTQSAPATFSFMKLPSDIRQHFYAMILPRQEVPMTSGEWVGTIGGVPSQFISILRLNKQISDEARKVFYGSAAFTITISDEEIKFLNNTREARHFLPFPSISSMQYIKNWQLDLRLKYNADLLCGDGNRTEEGLLTASVELAKISDLQTLKVTIPCLCADGDVTPVHQIYTAVSRTMAPLRRLRFKGDVRFFAAPPLKGDIAQSNKHASPVTQCQRPECLAFANSFIKTKAIMQSTIPPSPLSPRQTKWLGLKKEATSVLGWIPSVRFALSLVWRAMGSSKAEFAQTAEMCHQAIMKEFDAQLRDGRYRNYRSYRKWGIPESEWGEMQALSTGKRDHEIMARNGRFGEAAMHAAFENPSATFR